MTDTRDPRGIVSFFIRYLVLHAVFLLDFALSYVTDFFLFYFFGFIGFFTFLQVLIAIPRKFLDEAGSWKPVAIAGALLSDVAVLWWLGGQVSGFFGGLQLGARNHMVAFPLPRCLLRVGAPRVLPLAGSSTNYYA